MSTGVATLLPRHVFGMKGDVRANLHYLDEGSVLYPAGHNNTIIYQVRPEDKPAVDQERPSATGPHESGWRRAAGKRGAARGSSVFCGRSASSAPSSASSTAASSRPPA